MRLQRNVILAAALLVCAGSTAFAQDKGKVGLAMGYPSAIGVQWHVSDKVAVRPEISFTGTSSESNSNSFNAESDSWSIGADLSVLFYLNTDDKLRTYFVPRFTWARASDTNKTSSVTTSTNESTAKAVGGGGSFGAQYAVSDRFLVFGELGFNFAHTSRTVGTGTTKVTGNGWGTRTAVGIVFFP